MRDLKGGRFSEELDVLNTKTGPTGQLSAYRNVLFLFRGFQVVE